MSQQASALRFSRIEVQGYRLLGDVSVPLSGLNVLIGPNGCGKSTLLDVFALLAAGANEDLSRAISSRGGMTSLLSRSPSTNVDADRFRLKLESDVQADQPLTYNLEIARTGSGFQIADEVLSPFQKAGKKEPFKWIHNRPGHPRYYDGHNLVPPTWEYKDSELALAQAPRTYPIAEQFRARLRATRFYSFLDVSASSLVRLPQDLDPIPLLPGQNGEHLVAALYNVRTHHEDTYERILDALRAGFPSFRDLDFPLVAAGKATLLWKEKGFAKGFQAHELSEGTLRYLWLTAVLLSPQLPPVVLFDEPEVSLHPELLKLLAGLLREAAERSQILVATHSDRLIRWLSPGDLMIFDRRDGDVSITRADDPSLNLDEWLKKYTLDELWLMGELGGRP
jgi:predicted ATPase